MPVTGSFPEQPSLPDGVTLRTRGEVESLVLELPGGGSGEVALHGGHVLSWCPPGRGEVLFVSEQARFEPGTAIRGGIPVCFPWFGPGRSGEMAPAHGWARTSQWSLVDVERADDGLAVTLRTSGPLGEPGAPEGTLTLVVRVGAMLRLEVVLEAEPGAGAEIALHSYFRVPDLKAVAVEGLDGAGYLDQLTGERHRQEGDVTFEAETDRVYEADGPLVLRGVAGGGALRLTPEGLGSAVLWNPWADKAARTADLGDDEWRGFVCVEIGAVRDRALVVPQAGRVSGAVSLEIL